MEGGPQQPSAVSSEVQHSCSDPDVIHSCRRTEQEAATERGSSAVEAVTGRLRQWTTACSEEPKETGSEMTGGGGASVGGGLSSVKDRLGVAGAAVSGAASGIQEKISETFGDFKSKAFSR